MVSYYVCNIHIQFEVKYVTTCTKFKSKKKNEMMRILSNTLSEILKSFLTFDTHFSHLSLGSFMLDANPMPDKNPQSRNKESSVESPAEKNFWLAVVEKITKTKHVCPYLKEQMKLTKVSGALDPCSNELVWPGSW